MLMEILTTIIGVLPLNLMLKEFISKQTAFNKTIEEKLSNAERNIASLAKA